MYPKTFDHWVNENSKYKTKGLIILGRATGKTCWLFWIIAAIPISPSHPTPTARRQIYIERDYRTEHITNHHNTIVFFFVCLFVCFFLQPMYNAIRNYLKIYTDAYSSTTGFKKIRAEGSKFINLIYSTGFRGGALHKD